jgi:hypothetical protein
MLLVIEWKSAYNEDIDELFERYISAMASWVYNRIEMEH